MELTVIPTASSLLTARYQLRGPAGVAELDITISGRGRIRANERRFLALHRLFGEHALYLSSGHTVVAEADRRRWYDGRAIEVHVARETFVMQNESLWSPNQVLSSGEDEIGRFIRSDGGTTLALPDRLGLHIAAFLVWIDLRGRYLISG